MKKVQIIVLFFFLGCAHNRSEKVDFIDVVDQFNENKNDFSDTQNRLSEGFFSSALADIKKDLLNLRLVNLDDLTNEQKIDYQFI